MPDVTVIVPTRNRSDRLGLTVRSVLRQVRVDLDLVVVDDASSDGTAETVARFGDPRVRYVRSDVARGESGARNRGVELATGRWIAFVDDDDVWAPDKLAMQLEALDRGSAAWAYAGHVVVDERLEILHGAPPPSAGDVLRDLVRFNAIPASASNVVVDSDLLREAGPFDEGLRRTADWDMWLRLARHGPPACAASPLVAICFHRGNVSRDMAVMFDELDVVAARYGIPVDVSRHLRWAAWNAMLDGRAGEAIRYYSRAALRGDVRSIGRAALALAAPLYPAPWLQAARRGDAEWIERARNWLKALIDDSETARA